MSHKKLYSGQLSLYPYREVDTVFLSSISKPLLVELEWMTNRNVSVRYWIISKPATIEEAKEDHFKRISGVAFTELQARYSEITGYLWTDQNLMIGGHNLLNELENNIGKWLILEIEY